MSDRARKRPKLAENATSSKKPKKSSPGPPYLEMARLLGLAGPSSSSNSSQSDPKASQGDPTSSRVDPQTSSSLTVPGHSRSPGPSRQPRLERAPAIVQSGPPSSLSGIDLTEFQPEQFPQYDRQVREAKQLFAAIASAPRPAISNLLLDADMPMISPSAPPASGPPASLSEPDISEFRPNQYPTYERNLEEARNLLAPDPSAPPSSPPALFANVPSSLPSQRRSVTPPRPPFSQSGGYRRKLARWRQRIAARERRKEAEELARQNMLRRSSLADPALPSQDAHEEKPASTPGTSAPRLSQGSVRGREPQHPPDAHDDVTISMEEPSDETSHSTPLSGKQSRRSPSSSPGWQPGTDMDIDSNESDKSDDLDDDANTISDIMITSQEVRELDTMHHVDADDAGSVESEEDQEAPGDDDGAEEEDSEGAGYLRGDDDTDGDDDDEEDEDEHYEHLRQIEQDLAPTVEPQRPESADSNTTTYSEAIEAALEARQRTERGILDLGRDGLTLDATEEQFAEFEAKLLKLQKQFSTYQQDTLSAGCQRIDLVLRLQADAIEAWKRKNANRGGGAGAGGGNGKRPQVSLDEEEIQEARALISAAHLTYEQRILRCENAQELIDDLEHCPIVPILHEANLVEAIDATGVRCGWLSTYFRLIKAGRAVAWLQMRGPLASNLINIWSWKLLFDVDITLEGIKDVNTAWGKDWCLLELLRKVENQGEGTPAQRYTVDLYSTKYIIRIDGMGRPRPLYPTASLMRASAWQTTMRYALRDTLAHRNLFRVPPTQLFAEVMLDNMRYSLKWHLSQDLEDWPIPVSLWDAALLRELKHELAKIARPANPFDDADLANPDAGGRQVSAEEAYDAVLSHTVHMMKPHDKAIKKVHAKYHERLKNPGRKSRRKPIGNIMPDTLLAPPPGLEAQGVVPPLAACREAKTVRVEGCLAVPFWLAFGAEMCSNCRRREIPRQGVQRACFNLEGESCVECFAKNQTCLRWKFGVKNISSKDWQPKRPPRGLVDRKDIAAVLDEAWYGGKASKDTAPPETWEEPADEYWQDMRALERAEKEKEAKKLQKAQEKEAAKEKEAEQNADPTNAENENAGNAEIIAAKVVKQKRAGKKRKRGQEED